MRKRQVVNLVMASALAAAGKGLALESWQVSTPEREGVDTATLEALHQEIAAGKHGFIDDLLVIRHGAIVAEHHYQRDYERAAAGRGQPSHQYNYYDPKWHPYVEGREEHTLQSVTKSVTSLLIGIAIGRGEIPGVGSPALALLGDRKFSDPDGRKAKITLEDLLTMRAGIAWDENSVPYTDPRNDCAQMEASKDWVQFVLDKPMASDPGTVWVYSSGVSQLLSAHSARAHRRDRGPSTRRSTCSARSAFATTTGRRHPTVCPTPKAASISSLATWRASVASCSRTAGGRTSASCPPAGCALRPSPRSRTSTLPTALPTGPTAISGGCARVSPDPRRG